MKTETTRKRLLFYVWVGLAYATLWILSNLHNYPGQPGAVVLNNLWRLLFIVPVNFILFEYTWPFIRKKRRTIFYNILVAIPLVWLYLMLYSYGLYGWRQTGIFFGIYTSLLTYPTAEQMVESQMAFSAGSFFFFAIIRHLYRYTKLKQATQQLRIEKQQAELNYLKSQTNPHFLFNTLNNIYALAREKSDRAPEAILRLSKILRFTLYETTGDYIAVEQELKIIGDYIALERLRYDESLQINFNYDVEDKKQAIPPLLLMPLVENAFKHGVSETRGRPFIDIHLTIKQRRLLFVVKNSTEAISPDIRVKENIGLSNLRRQLELLYTDYNLSVQQGNAEFTATLTINLASHV